MTISDTDKIDFLWKKVIYGVTKTANSAIKSGANESIASPYAISSDNVWTHASIIPAIPPTTTTADVIPYIGSERIRATYDNTVTPYKTWLATATYNSPISTLKTFIPPSYGPGYIAAIFIGDPNTGPAARIFPDAENEEYVFDYSAGVLTFVNNIPVSRNATIGSGPVTVQANGIYIIAYRYVGPTGGGGGGGGGIGDYVSKTGDTMTGQLIFSMTNEIDGKTILFSADPTANSYAGIGTLNTGETRLFANSSSVLSLGHMSTIDGETYTPDLSIGPDGVVTIGSAADGIVSVEDGYRIVLGHISPANDLTENFVIEANGTAYSNKYEILTSGSNTGVLAGYASSSAPLATGTYLSANIVVDNTGRIISASDGSGGTGGGSGSVTQVNLTGSSSISVTGLPITTNGTYVIDLSNTGVSVGTYSKVSVDIKGRITAGSALSNTDVNTALGYTPLQYNQSITISGDITGSGTNAITTALSATGVLAGNYTLASITVDSKGRITNASSGAAIGTVTSVNANSTTLSITGGPVTSSGTLSVNLSTFGAVGTYTKVVTDSYGRVSSGSLLSNTDVATALGFTPGQGTVTGVSANGTDGISVTGSPISSSGTFNFSLADTAVSAGTYTVSTIVVDAKGRITYAENGTVAGTGTVTSVSAVGDNGISVTGSPISSSGTLNFSLTNTLVTAGTYTVSTIVVDSQGRITRAESGTASGAGTVTSVGADSTTLSISGGPITSTGNLSINLPTLGVVGTYTKVVTDAYGRISSGALLSNTDVNTALGYTPLKNNESIALSGDIAGSGSNAITTALSTTGVTAGTYTLSRIVVDSKGRITNATSGTAGTVTSVSAANSSNITATNTSPITTSGTLAFDLSDTGVTAGTYNFSTIVVDLKGRITRANSGVSTGGGAFGVTKSNTSVVSSTTTLNFKGNGVSVTDQGGGIAAIDVPDRVEYAYFQYGSGGSGQFTNGDNLISNSANMAVTITDPTNCVVKFTFTGYTNPPIGIAVYGQSYTTNQFTYNAVNGSYAGGATRVISGGGTALSPTFMTTFTDITLQMKMADTGASAGVGQRAHAYIVFKF